MSALILLGSGLSGAQLDVGWTPEQIARWERAEEDDDWPAMAELDMEAWAPMGADDELRAMFVENAVWSNSEDPATDEPVAERVSGITAPTLVITGAGTSAGSTTSATGSPGRFPCSLGRNPGGRSHDSLAGA